MISAPLTRSPAKTSIRSLRPVSFASGFLRGFPGTLGAYLRAHDAAALDDLSALRRRIQPGEPAPAGGRCALIFFPVATAAAFQVRFTLMATFGATLLAAMTASTPERRRAAIAIGLTVSAASIAGLTARHQTSVKFFRQFAVLTEVRAEPATPVPSVPAEPPASRDCGIDTDSSIAIRNALALAAIAAIRRAGPFGLGLNTVQQRSCLGMTPHNTALQALAEIGWIGGGALIRC